MFLASVSWNQVVPFLPTFLREIGVGKNLYFWSGAIFAAPAIASILAMPFWGKMGDKYGRKPMIIRAGIFLIIIYFGMSFCHTPWQLVILRFLNGALTGFIPGSVTLIATNTPQEEAPKSVAIAQSFAAAGQIVGPSIGALLAGLAGYRGSMRISGTAVLISTILVYLLVKEPNKTAPADKTSLFQDFKISLRSPVMASVMVAVLLQGAFVQAINPFLRLHMETMGGNADLSTGMVIALPALAFVVTAYLWTRFGETWGYSRAILTGLVGCAIITAGLTLAQNIWSFSILYFGAGIFLASINPSMGAIIVNKVDQDFRGRAYGMQYSASMLGAFVAPVAASRVASAYGIPSIFTSIGIVFLAGALIFSGMVKRWDKAPPQSE